MLTEIEQKVVASLQGDIPISERPFLEIAQKLEIEEETLLNILKDLRDRGIIRRFGATLRHQKSGFRANAMVAWQVDEKRVEKVGRTMASFSEVTHCYRRDPNPLWPFNLYTMVHARDETTCRAIARRLSLESGVDTYRLLFSRHELKKTSMQYFPEADTD